MVAEMRQYSISLICHRCQVVGRGLWETQWIAYFERAPKARGFERALKAQTFLGVKLDKRKNKSNPSHFS